MNTRLQQCEENMLKMVGVQKWFPKSLEKLEVEVKVNEESSKLLTHQLSQCEKNMNETLKVSYLSPLHAPPAMLDEPFFDRSDFAVGMVSRV